MNNVPKVYLADLAARYQSQIDLFICAVSFESRSVSIANSLEPPCVSSVMVCCNKEMWKEAAAFREIITERFPSKVTEVETELNDPLYTANILLSALHKIVAEQKVQTCVIDITTFTHEVLLILLKVIYIALHGTGCQVDFIYTAASDYSLNETEKEKKWLARGVGNVRSILGYSGIADPSKKTHLIILTGFETERSQKLIDIYEPAKVSLGVGRPHTAVSEEHHRVNKLNFDQLPVSRDQVTSFSFSCTNPSQARIDLGHQIDLDAEYNVVIAALNTKLSTIGVGLFAMEHPEVQLCYATANAYNIKYYSLPADFCYIYTKKFEYTRKTRKHTS
jgi:hypothetical protein